MGRRKNSAMRKENLELSMISNKQNQIYYQKHQPKSETNILPFNPTKQRKSVSLVPKSINQENYILALQDESTDIVVVSGPAGTGKTFLAVLAAIQALRNKEVERIVLCRPAISIENENHGFLPGSLTEKLAPWTRPMIDTLREYYSLKDIENMISDEIIEFAPLGMIRGRQFRNTFLIIDEAQNSTPEQLKALLTRIGEGSKFVIGGDVEQADRTDTNNGLLDLRKRLSNSPIESVQCCEFTEKDIQRHRLIKEFIHLYNR